MTIIGGRAIQFAIFGGVGSGGRGGGCTTIKTRTFLKREVGLVIRHADIL